MALRPCGGGYLEDESRTTLRGAQKFFHDARETCTPGGLRPVQADEYGTSRSTGRVCLRLANHEAREVSLGGIVVGSEPVS